MRDLLRSYRLKLKRKGSIASDSDTESQPLVSSTSSSATFGSVDDRCMFMQGDDSTTDDCGDSPNANIKINSDTVTKLKNGDVEKNLQNHKKDDKQHLIAGKSFVRRPFCYPAPSDGVVGGGCGNSSFDVFANNEAIYDRFQYFRKASGVLLEDTLIPAMLVSTKKEQSGDFHNGYSNGNNNGNNNVIMVQQQQQSKRHNCRQRFSADNGVGGGEQQEEGTQNSIVTIFAIWNTIIGSSLLAISWGLEKSGLFPGIFLILCIAAICLYTSYVILKVNESYGMYKNNEVPDLCRLLLGKWAEIVAKIVSLIVLIGANIVYWILMSNFLYNAVIFIYDYAFSIDETLTLPSNLMNFTTIITTNPELIIDKHHNLLCPKSYNDTIVAILPKASLFHHVWDLNSTVPVVLGLLMFPLLNFKSATFFTKFNSLGTISVAYLILLVVVKGSLWGVNMPADWWIEWRVKPNFSALSGMLSLSFFIHNIIISICKNNRHQENNGRDISIAFILATITYLMVGVVFYVTFPLSKSCIEDNILNNFPKFDAMAMIARILLLFQLFTVFPLISYMLRMDVTSTLNSLLAHFADADKQRLEFSYVRVVLLNFFVVVICILFACFLPHIGTLIRYTGALSGMVYIFTLPSLLKIAALRREGRLTVCKCAFHVAIVVVGALNLGMQFFVKDS